MFADMLFYIHEQFVTCIPPNVRRYGILYSRTLLYHQMFLDMVFYIQEQF